MKLFNQLPRWLAGAFLLFCAQPALATVVITHSPGGIIDEFVQRYEIIRASGDDIVVAGECDSACTLMLGIVPKAHMCATKAGVFGFHSATMVDIETSMSLGFAKEATEALWQGYPANVRAVLRAHGWHGQEHPDLINISARTFLRPCGVTLDMAAFPTPEYYAPVETPPPPPAPRQQPAAPKVHHAPLPKPAPVKVQPAPVVVPAPVEPPVVVVPVTPVHVEPTEEQPSMKLPVPELSWLWDIGFFLLIGIALGVVVNAGRNVWKIWKATRAVANIAEGNK